MWTGVFPAVTTKFTEDDELDHAEMERCFALQMEAGCDGIIVCGSLGEGPDAVGGREDRRAEDRAKRGRRQAGAADHQRSGDPRRRCAGAEGRPGRAPTG